MHGLRREEFRFLVTVLANKSQASSIANFILDKGLRGIDTYIPDITDQAYFLENPWRNTWDQNKFETSSWNVPENASYARCLNNFIWESHLDASISDGVNLNLPTPWVCHELNLNFNKDSLTWDDHEGNVVIRNISFEANTCTLLNYKAAEKFFKEDKTFISISLKGGLGSKEVMEMFHG